MVTENLDKIIYKKYVFLGFNYCIVRGVPTVKMSIIT